MQYTKNIMFDVRSHSSIIFLFYNKTVKFYMVGGTWTVIVGI